MVLYSGGSRAIFTIHVAQALLTHDIRLIVADYIGVAGTLAVLPMSRHIPLAIFLHDDEGWSRLTWYRRWAFARAEGLLCNSEYTRTRLVAAHPEAASRARTCLLAGIPEAFGRRTPRATPRYQDWFSDRGPYLLFVGRLCRVHRYKGYFALIAAMSLLRRDGGAHVLRLAIVGDGDDRHAVESEIASQGLTSVVRVFPDVGDNDLAAFYAGATAFVFPSTGEGFGLVVLEAMSFAKPVIAAKGPPLDEILDDGHTGILLPDVTPLTIANTLRKVESKPDSLREIGEAGRKAFEEKFESDHFAKRLVTSLSSLGLLHARDLAPTSPTEAS